MEYNETLLEDKTTISRSVKICDACGQRIEEGEWYNRYKVKRADGSIDRASRHYECAVAVHTYCTSGEILIGADSREYNDDHFLEWCKKEGFDKFGYIAKAIEQRNKCRMTE